ncbi:MAG: SDR family NAD(P)-dependent oxidoreductase [Armatimonadota bacterium]
MAGRVEGKVAMVTGGASGIGRATCLLLAEEGAKVAVADLQQDRGRAVAEEIAAQGGDAAFYALDVSDENQVRAGLDQVVARFGRLDVLVNNAGIAGVNKPTHELEEAEWDAVFAVDVKGVFFCTKHAIPHMRAAGGGSIINVSSVYGLVSDSNVPPYHAAKGAVALMTKTDALLYARDRIRVNSIHPGHVATPIHEWVRGGSERDRQRIIRLLAEDYPLGRIGEPRDVAYGIVYLASDEASFVTGAQLVVDGGYSAR